MKPLRAFLCCRDGAGIWTTSAFRDLDSLLHAWPDAHQARLSGAAMHVGVWRPDTSAMAALAESHPGLLILSESVVRAMPGEIAVSETPVGVIDGLAFRLALSGFGYDAAVNYPPSTAEARAVASECDGGRGLVRGLSPG